MSCDSCKNKELSKDDVNKILSVEFVNQHSMEEVAQLYQMGYRLAENVS
jgi:hypothetical protein